MDDITGQGETMNLDKLRFALIEEIVVIASIDRRTELHLGLSKLLERVGKVDEIPLPLDSKFHSVMHEIGAEATTRLPRRAVMFDELSRDRIVLDSRNMPVVLKVPPTTFYVLPSI